MCACVTPLILPHAQFFLVPFHPSLTSSPKTLFPSNVKHLAISIYPSLVRTSITIHDNLFHSTAIYPSQQTCHMTLQYTKIKIKVSLLHFIGIFTYYGLRGEVCKSLPTWNGDSPQRVTAIESRLHSWKNFDVHNRRYHKSLSYESTPI